tara:strand:+ start:1388 stop:2200 length:813 start_codon:yes stop_codon:yes gene_type:complete
MDLYSSGGSIAQVNSQTAKTRADNQATQDFNNTLAENLDLATTELDSAAASKNQKDLLSIGTSGGKIVSKTGIVQAGGSAIKKLGQQASARLAPAAGDTLIEGEGAATTVTTVEDVAAGSEALEAGSEGARLALDAGKTALKGAAITGGKALIAGAGGALDLGEDISAFASGKRGVDVFGSNNYSRIGNLMNIAGSALEVGGVVTGGITPWSIGAEILGAGIGAVGAGLELAGDVEGADEKKEKTTQDIQSQARSLGGTQAVTTEVARSN